VRWIALAASALVASTVQAQVAQRFEHGDQTQQRDVAEARAAAAPPEAQLEQAGATIRAITVTVDNVFDPSNPEEDKPLYRLANKVHVRTHPSVIESALTFRVGDRYAARVLDESARTLRTRGYLADVKVAAEAYDAVSNTVAVTVRVRDAWTLAPELHFSHRGGQSEWALGLDDRNLFGTGKQVQIIEKSMFDRDETLLSYGDPNLLGSRVRLNASYAEASDGYRHVLTAERPFYSLDARWMLGGNLLDQQRVDPIYDRGEQIDEFGHDVKGVSMQGGWSRGLVDGRVTRWVIGAASSEDVFYPTIDTPQPLLLPENRKLVYPWVGWELLVDDHREMSQLNDIGRTEDVSFGTSLFMSVGFADTRYGSDRDATLLRAAFQKGWDLGGAGRMLTVNAAASTRDESGGLQNSIVDAAAHYYVRHGEGRLFAATAAFTATNNLDGELQVLLGGDNGLRGYPLRYQAGERRSLLSVEERFFTDLYPWRLFRVGYAAFLDAGRVSGEDPRASPSTGTLYDVGLGLRLSSPRSSGKSVVHIDLAFPLNGDPTIDTMQLIVETKGSF
jgi:outer membrane translocation and assembly module TamA